MVAYVHIEYSTYKYSEVSKGRAVPKKAWSCGLREMIEEKNVMIENTYTLHTC